MIDALDSYFGFLRSTLGMSESPLNAMIQATEQQHLTEIIRRQPPTVAGTLARIERERFYRSCSQHWLNAMIDVELGLNQP